MNEQQNDSGVSKSRKERLVINPYARFKLLAWVVMLVLAYPASYLMLEVNLGWMTVPVMMTLAFVYLFLWHFQSEAHDKAKKYDRGL